MRETPEPEPDPISFTPITDGDDDASVQVGNASDEDASDEKIRLNNAYPGASNSVGSIHQRRWYLSLDRVNSGFHPTTNGDGQRVWLRRKWRPRKVGEGDGEGYDEDVEGFEGFVVRGREVERSVVTGRTAREVMSDEGVNGFVERKGWSAVVE